MLYSILGVKDDPSASITIVASERREALQAILRDIGFTELLGEIQGHSLLHIILEGIYAHVPPCDFFRIRLC